MIKERGKRKTERIGGDQGLQMTGKELIGSRGEGETKYVVFTKNREEPALDPSA